MLCMQQYRVILASMPITDHLDEQSTLAHHPLMSCLLSSGRGQQQQGVVRNCIFSLMMGSSSGGVGTLN